MKRYYYSTIPLLLLLCNVNYTQFDKYNDNVSVRSATNAESNDLTTLTKEHPTGKHLGGEVLGR